MMTGPGRRNGWPVRRSAGGRADWRTGGWEHYPAIPPRPFSISAPTVRTVRPHRLRRPHHPVICLAPLPTSYAAVPVRADRPLLHRTAGFNQSVREADTKEMPKRPAGPKKTTSRLGRMFHLLSLGPFTVRHDRRSAYFGPGPVWDVNFLGGMNTVRGTSWNIV